MKATDSNIIFLQSEDLKVAFFTQGTAQSEGTLRENSITRQPDFRDVFGVFEDFSNVTCTVRTNEVVRQVKLTKCRMLLYSFANCNAASHHSTVICEVKDKQVSFVTKNFCNSERALFANGTIGQM